MESNETLEAAAPTTKKAKNKTYDSLSMLDAIAYEVTTQHTVSDEDGVSLSPEKVVKSATKAFWEALPKFEKGSRVGQSRDINEGLKSPQLIGYIENGKIVKF